MEARGVDGWVLALAGAVLITACLRVKYKAGVGEGTASRRFATVPAPSSNAHAIAQRHRCNRSPTGAGHSTCMARGRRQTTLHPLPLSPTRGAPVRFAARSVYAAGLLMASAATAARQEGGGGTPKLAAHHSSLRVRWIHDSLVGFWFSVGPWVAMLPLRDQQHQESAAVNLPRPNGRNFE